MAVQFILQDPATTRIIKSGLAEALPQNRFQVKIPAAEVADLTGDLYYLFLAAYSDELATMIERRVDLEVGGAPLQPEPSPTAATETQPTAQAEPTTTAVPSTPTGESDDDGGVSIGLIIGLVLAAAAAIGGGLLFVVLRSGRKAE